MFDLYYVDRWDETTQEPVSRFCLLVGGLPSLEECKRQEHARAGAAALDHGPGEMVTLDVKLGRLLGVNVRVNPYQLELEAALARTMIGSGVAVA